jgi:hypothetical protein
LGGPSDSGRALTAVSNLLDDPGATIYFTDGASGGRIRRFDPTSGVPATADHGSFVAAFSDRRPDRSLTLDEVGALAALTTPPPRATAPSHHGTPSASETAAEPPPTSPIILPPPPRPATSAAARPHPAAVDSEGEPS